MHRFRLIGIIAAIFVAYLTIAALWYTSPNLNGNGQTQSGHSLLTGSKIAGPFTLVDHNGEVFDSTDHNHTFKLIYFGFTYCPSICPTELQKMALTLHKLEKNADKILPVFISVDPDRDTPDILKQYVALFDPGIIGLTGTQSQIDTVINNYKIYAAKVQEEDMSDYTVDHSSYTYLLDPKDNLIALFKTNDTAGEMAQKIKEILGKYSGV